MEVNLREIYSASEYLSEMGDVYSDVIKELAKTEEVTATFEGGSTGAAWLNLLHVYWGLCADSQDNMNDTSMALVYYINEVCETDGKNAQTLKADVESYNENLFKDLASPDESSYKDDDKYIDEDEREDAGYSEKYFNKLDENNDGKISQKEQEKDELNKPLDEPNLENKDEVIEEKDKPEAVRPEGAK